MLDETPYTDDAADRPSSVETLAGVRMSARRLPANGETYGSDWCEAFLTTPHTIAISIGDVCGHGAAKRPTMVLLRAAIRRAAHAGYDAVETLASANRELCSETTDLATALFGLLDVRSGALSFANAGHPPPIVAHARGASFIEYDDADLVLGYEADVIPTIRRTHPASGARRVLHRRAERRRKAPHRRDGAATQGDACGLRPAVARDGGLRREDARDRKDAAGRRERPRATDAVSR